VTDLPGPELRSHLADLLPLDRWRDAVVDRAPYATDAALLDAVREAASPLSSDEVDAALGAQPGLTLGDPVHRPGADALDPAEEAGGTGGDRTTKALAEGAATYRARFGRPFVLRTAGRDQGDVLDELDRRLLLDEAAELAEVERELRDIVVARVRALLGADTVEQRVARGSGPDVTPRD